MKRLTALVLAFIVFSGVASAQQSSSSPGHKHQTYIEAGISHSQGEVLGSDYLVNDLSIEIETYFNSLHWQLSGWGIGYRKDDLRYSDFGHMLYFKLFREVRFPFVSAKTSAGVEWGMPTINFDRTKFVYNNGLLESYSQVSLVRNSNVPFTGSDRDAAMYPIMEVSAVKRNKYFVVEAGARWNVMEFKKGEYVLVGDRVESKLSKEWKAIPYLFMNIGFGTN